MHLVTTINTGEVKIICSIVSNDKTGLQNAIHLAERSESSVFNSDYK